MGYIFAFEDGSSTPSSKLLSIIQGIKFVFSGGIDKLTDYVLDMCYKNTSDVVYVFVDTVPDNDVTLYKFITIVQAVISSGNKNIFVIPIICMEYYILKMLSLHYDFKVAKDNREMYLSYVINEDFTYPVPKGKTIEKCYKDILNSNIRNCMTNNISRGNGKFYLIDCKDCNRERCLIKNNDKGKLLLKALCLYTKLPVFEIISGEQEEIIKNSGICGGLEEIDVEDVLIEVRKYYHNVFNMLGINGDVVLDCIYMMLK